MNNSETLSLIPENYKDQLAAILSRVLTPENINTYADSALSSLVELADKTTNAYSGQPTIQGATRMANEDAAFNYFDIGTVGTSLDYVAKVAGDIDHLDTIVAQAEAQEHVILPAGKIEGIKIFQSDHESMEKSEAKKLIPRLKTVLFILENDFNVNLDNQPEEVSINYGIIDPKSIRKQPYYVIDVPRIDRIICLNDEDENVSYVINAEVLKTLDLDMKTIQVLTKQDIDALLKEHEGLGSRVVYSKQFVNRIKEALGAESDAHYLVPRAPEGIQSAKSAALSMGISREKFLAIVETLGEALGETEEHRFGTVVTTGYTATQVGMVKEYYNQHKPKNAPEGVRSRGGLARELGISDYLLDDAIKQLIESGELGEVEEFTFANKAAEGYYPNQQDLIINLLANQGKIGNERPPEACKSFIAVAREIGVSRKTLDGAVAALNEVLGEIKSYQFGSMVAPGLLSEQQDIVKDYLSGIKRIAPEGALSESGIADALGTTSKSVRKAITALAEQGKLGEVDSYTFGAKTVPGYLSEQQTLIRDWLEENHYLDVEDAPEGYLVAAAIADRLHVQLDRVMVAIASLVGDAEFGEVKYYRFGTRKAPGYSPDQQDQIEKYLKDNTAEMAPTDYLPEFGIVKKYGLSRGAVEAAIARALPGLGKIEIHQYKNGPLRSFSPVQQDVIVGLARSVR